MFVINQKNPLVSIVIPCCNAGNYVSEAIESALQQTYCPVEVIVINDGSTDNSLEIIKRYKKHIYYETWKNRGPGASRNQGLAVAKGSFIQFLDADDKLAPEKIERSVKVFNPDIGVVFTDLEEFFENRRTALKHSVRSKIVKPLRERSAVWKEEDVLVSILRMAVGTPLPLHRKEILLKYGGFREDLRILEDVELVFRLALSGVKFLRINEKLVKVRNHSDPNRLRLTPEKNILALKAINLMHVQAMNANELGDGVKSALSDLFANHGCKAYRLSYIFEAEEAFKKAYSLNPYPKPSGVPLYNFFSRVFGLKKTEDIFMFIKNINKKIQG